MSILDLLYREYCRARLAEMRKQFLVPTVGDDALDMNWDATNPANPGDRGNGLESILTTSQPSTVR
ncbi:hypothetical protein MTX26_07160 [Bradyrhizobium sp. ISRA443]|uniref:hypothetical protein n=1 Tax=unclassified Bradyrhizobium TaxID=2631580 RepID=UPI00247A2EAA|nr:MULTISPECIES: hypothetical protein [unclassified Bradyrhizobium]WGR95557.1 hypothetical protein MTX20_17410 [Bradyrhizobium sp. ISRA435]WGS00608.1 hypothetical protein MTX23_07155 [Bradyrhizobium sp. ISRA436]WGS07497.1 hypothetical protein MTX18_07155 [Bradyrhizobium sp. ISRA437]WGS14383.1 hypothetical protein MTX26_07160 [Bradyrhizobium sp. ISRA443]